MKKRGIRNLHLADVNFGMYKRDKQICEVLAKTRNEYGWPFQIMTTTGKNSKKRVIEATDILGDTLRVNMSVQSMDKSVLKNIKRENIKLDDYIGISEILRNKGRSTQAEVIIGLPGESRKTFLKGMEDLLNSGVSEIGMYTLMALHGTEFKDPEYRKQFKMKGKHRIVPLNFGNYDEENIFDIEEVIIQTKDMSFEDYLWIRGFCLTVEIIHNSRPFIEFVKYVNSFKISNYDFILALYNDIHKAPVIIKKLYDEYLRETKEELWPTENSVFKQYKKPKNYDNLLNGRVGGNLIYKYKSLSLNSYINEWIEYLATISLEFTNKSVSYSKKERKIEVDTLKEYSLKRVTGIMDSKADLSPLEMKSNYNIRSWLDSNNSTLLCDHKSKFPISYKLIFSDEQLKTRKDLFERYGTDIPALSKIVTRVGNLENLFRRVITDDDKKQIKLSKKDKFVRYSLSN